MLLYISLILLSPDRCQRWWSCVTLLLMLMHFLLLFHIKSFPRLIQQEDFMVKNLQEMQCIYHQLSEAFISGAILPLWRLQGAVRTVCYKMHFTNVEVIKYRIRSKNLHKAAEPLNLFLSFLILLLLQIGTSQSWFLFVVPFRGLPAEREISIY